MCDTQKAPGVQTEQPLDKDLPRPTPIPQRMVLLPVKHGCPQLAHRVVVEIKFYLDCALSQGTDKNPALSWHAVFNKRSLPEFRPSGAVATWGLMSHGRWERALT